MGLYVDCNADVIVHRLHCGGFKVHIVIRPCMNSHSAAVKRRTVNKRPSVQIQPLIFQIFFMGYVPLLFQDLDQFVLCYVPLLLQDCPFCPIPLLRRTVAPAQGIISILGLECTGTGRPYVPAFSLSGTVPAFTCDCLRFYAATKVRPVCVSTSSRTMLAFSRVVS